jgi:hypothetical protein
MSVQVDSFPLLALEIARIRGPRLSAEEQEAWDERFCAGRWHFTAPLRAWASIALAADPWAAEALFRGDPVPHRRCHPDALRVLKRDDEEIVLTGPDCLRLELALPTKGTA